VGSRSTSSSRRWYLRVAGLLAVAACDGLFHVDTVTVVDGQDTRCPPAYAQLATGLYRFETAAQPWSIAETKCVADAISFGKPTHLAVIASQTELNAVFAYAQSIESAKVWVGLSNIVTPPASCAAGTGGDSYQWVTDESSAEPASGPPWYPGDPLFPCTQACVEMFVDRPAIDDASCSDQYAFLCECDDYAEDRAHF